MNTLDFLRRVLPTEGVYVLTVINENKPRQAFYNTVDELAVATLRSDKLGNNTYYAISSFLSRENRKKENVKLTKVVALDVDCGDNKPFTDWKAGLQGLLKFITETGLPKPMVIHSGNGLHAYWVMDKALPPDQWKPIAETMKAATAARGFEVDAGLTANSALVLRAPGTHNPKNGNEVRLLIDAEPISPEQLKKLLAVYRAAAAMGLNAPPPKQMANRSTNLLEAMAARTEYPPAVSATLENKCAQIRWASKNQSKVDEPTWYNMIGIAAFCELPEITAKEWSHKHPTYSEQATLAKLAQWQKNTTGPTTCSKFESDRPSGCDKCKFKGKIGSPARLGVRYEEKAISVDVPTVVDASLQIPDPYKLTDSGIKRTLDGTDLDVCPFEIYPVGYGVDESLGYETVRYKWRRLHIGWVDLSMRQAFLADGSREFATCIADQGIVLEYKSQTEDFQAMLRKYMDELRKRRSMTNLYNTMGWKDDYKQFVLGNILHRKMPNGSVTREDISLSSGTNDRVSQMYGSKGDLAAWIQATKMLETADMPWHMFALGLGFAAPAFGFTGLKGLTVSLYGPTAAGKTLIQWWQQSIYGDPEKLHFASKFTQNTLFSRLGLYNNLPMTIDEQTNMPDDHVGEFCYWVTQGEDKKRLNRNSEERDAKTWATIVTVSTNRSFASKMTASGLDTDAQLARLLELHIPKHSLFVEGSLSGRMIYNFLRMNHGLVGPIFIDHLLEIGEVGIRSMIAEAIATFPERYGVKFTGEERFIEAGIVTTDLFSRIAKDLGLIAYDYTLGIKWALEQLGLVRATITDTYRTPFDILNEYLLEIANEVAVVMHTGSSKPALDFTRTPKNTIMARFDVYRKSSIEDFSSGTVMLVQPVLKKWLASRGVDWTTFKRHFQAEGIDATPASKKFTIGRDTAFKLGQQYVLGLNLNHPEFHCHLHDANIAAEEFTLGRPQLVSSQESSDPQTE